MCRVVRLSDVRVESCSICELSDLSCLRLAQVEASGEQVADKLWALAAVCLRRTVLMGDTVHQLKRMTLQASLARRRY
jgi:type II secretory pathway predicted ATPase ExeA